MSNDNIKKLNTLDSVVLPLKQTAFSFNLVKHNLIESINIQAKQINSQRSPLAKVKFKQKNNNTNKVHNSSAIRHKCRICLEDEINKSLLISPCKCEGSIKYLHSNCLKKWLITRKQSPFDSKCEICNAQFNIEVKKSSILNKERCKLFIKKKIYLIVLVFIGLFGSAISVDVFVIEPSSTKQKGIVSFILYSLVAIVYLIFLAKLQSDFKKQCYDDIILDWHILDISLDSNLLVGKLNNNTNTQSKISINNYFKENYYNSNNNQANSVNQLQRL